MKYPDSIARLINAFSAFPGVGQKMAARYAFYVVSLSKNGANDLADAIKNVKDKIQLCERCGNFCEVSPCNICQTRDNTIICVVSQPKDVVSLEKTGFKGVYHVLHGVLSPMDGKGPEEIRLKELFSRLHGVKEVIIATNPDVEGEATAIFISRLIKPMGIKVSRPAQGISLGTEIEYADEVTLTRAIDLRTEL